MFDSKLCMLTLGEVSAITKIATSKGVLTFEQAVTIIAEINFDSETTVPHGTLYIRHTEYVMIILFASFVGLSAGKVVEI